MPLDLRNDFDAASLRERASNESHLIRRRAEVIARLYEGESLSDILEDTGFSEDAAAYWTAVFNAEGVEGLGAKTMLSSRDMHPDVKASDIMERASRVRDPHMKSRLVALAEVAEGVHPVKVCRKAGINLPELRYWVDMFNRMDRYAFLTVTRPGMSRNSVRAVSADMEIVRLANLKLESPAHNSKRLEAVALCQQGASATTAARITGVATDDLTQWMRIYRAAGPHALLVDFSANGATTRQQVRRPARTSAVDWEVAEFARRNRVELLEHAAGRAHGPMGAAIFRALAAVAGGDGYNARAGCVNAKYLGRASAELQRGGIPAVEKWIKEEKIEVPRLDEIDRVAEDHDGTPFAKRLRAVREHLAGLDVDKSAELLGVSNPVFRQLFDSFRRFGFHSALMQKDGKYQVPKDPRLLEKIRARWEADQYRANVLRVAYKLETLEDLEKTDLDNSQRSAIRSLRKALTSDSVDDLKALGERPGFRRLVDRFNKLGADAVMSDSAKGRYAVPMTPGNRHALTLMALDQDYPLREVASAALRIGKGDSLYVVHEETGIELESMLDMAENFVQRAETFRQGMSAIIAEVDRKDAEEKSQRRVRAAEEMRLAAQRRKDEAAVLRAIYQDEEKRHRELLAEERRMEREEKVWDRHRGLLDQWEAVYGLEARVVAGAWDYYAQFVEDVAERLTLLEKHLPIAHTPKVLQFVHNLEVARRSLQAVRGTPIEYAPRTQEEADELASAGQARGAGSDPAERQKAFSSGP